MKVKDKPYVEGVIKHGKVYWRVIKSGEEIYNKYSNFDFANTNPWRMTWSQFRLFKDSGKRHSNVAIKKELFVKQFPAISRYQAGLIWDELKEKGILNDKDRLSDAWHALSDFEMKLDAIETYRKVFTNKEIKNYLEKLGGKKHEKFISKINFTKDWKHPDTKLKEFIWEKLRNRKVLSTEDKIQTLNFNLNDDLNMTLLDYSGIVNKLYKIVNDEENGKFIKEISDEIIHRPERSPKTWSKIKDSYRVRNNHPITKKHLVKHWDVGIYRDLKAHRPKKGSGWDYEHALSVAISENYINTSKSMLKKELSWELDCGGDYWWTIAIPHKLHVEGLTFQMPEDAQLKIKFPFFEDLERYCCILSMRPQDHKLTVTDTLKAFGAFRYLQRRQFAEPEPIDGQDQIGRAHYSFFTKKKPEVKKKVDQLLNENIRQCIAKLAGINAVESSITPKVE